jgi:hypothetical protein
VERAEERRFPNRLAAGFPFDQPGEFRGRIETRPAVDGRDEEPFDPTNGRDDRPAVEDGDDGQPAGDAKRLPDGLGGISMECVRSPVVRLILFTPA